MGLQGPLNFKFTLRVGLSHRAGGVTASSSLCCASSPVSVFSPPWTSRKPDICVRELFLWMLRLFDGKMLEKTHFPLAQGISGHLISHHPISER